MLFTATAQNVYLNYVIVFVRLSQQRIFQDYKEGKRNWQIYIVLLGFDLKALDTTVKYNV